jgi:GT2 family glycosyltransferase
MTVYALIPVFNRLNFTQLILTKLAQQEGIDLKIIVIDDGSTDGTSDYLASIKTVTTLEGDGNLWWAGAMELGLRYIHPLLKKNDYFLFINNDTTFDNDFVLRLITVSEQIGRAAVGCAVAASNNSGMLLSAGARADFHNFLIWDLAKECNERINTNAGEPLPEVLHVNLLPGRGTLYPAEVLDLVGYMRPALLPHYRADYEFSNRVARTGIPLVVSTRALLYNLEEFGTEKRQHSFWQRNFGKGSPDNRIHTYIFFILVGTKTQRLLAVPRLFIYTNYPYLRHAVSILMRHINRVGRGFKKLKKYLISRF